MAVLVLNGNKVKDVFTIKRNSAEEKLLKKLEAYFLVKTFGSIKPADRVVRVEYSKDYEKDLAKLAPYLAEKFGSASYDDKKKEITIVGPNKKMRVTFTKKKDPTGSSGKPMNTEVQEEGTTVVLNQVIIYNKKFNKPSDITDDDDTMKKLRKVFKAYDDDKIKELSYSYYEQQKEFLKKFQGTDWDIFRYDNLSFVKFFAKHIKNKVVARNLKPLDLVKKYTEWNPADIWAVRGMDKVKKEIDDNITPKTSNVLELNNLLINLFNEERLVGLSLKKIEKGEAKLKFVNITPANMKMAEIEKYEIKDIKFVVDNIFQGEAIATSVQFDGGTYKIDVGHAGTRTKAANLNFNTFIKATPAARGGQAPVEMLMKLFKNKGGSGITFTNDHNKYPKSSEEFFKKTPNKLNTKDFEKYYKLVKPYFKKSQNYSDFENHISSLYNKRGKNIYIAQTKLMMLHFFHDALKNNAKNKEFWTDILYLGMKVGKEFAPHAKIS